MAGWRHDDEETSVDGLAMSTRRLSRLSATCYDNRTTVERRRHTANDDSETLVDEVVDTIMLSVASMRSNFLRRFLRSALILPVRAV